MKLKAGLCAVCTLFISTIVAADPPAMKMTTPTPPGIATPDKLETRIGTLNLFDGVPDKQTTELVYEELAFQRATQAFLATLPTASMAGMEAGLRKFGPPNTTALLFEDLMDSKALWLTPNTVSIYQAMWLELGDEPMVLETPPKVLGLIDNAWFRYVLDFGNAGPDKGKGGKFLLVPPGYEGDIPEGYYVYHTKTHGNWMVWRGFQVDGSTKPAIEETKKFLKVYPLSQKSNPPEIKFINLSGVAHSTLGATNFSFWEDINRTIQDEPDDAHGIDPEIRGMLAAVGIKKGQDFDPDPKLKKILTEAAEVGTVMARALVSQPQDEDFYTYPGELHWTNPFIKGNWEFLQDGVTLLDSRAYMHFYATGITPAMAIKNVGVGSQYLIAYLDADGNGLDGSKTYKIHLPPNVPAKNFWSFTLYDNQTRSELQTDQRFPGIDNVSGSVKANSDGSYEIYFGPKPPKGKENNWIQTVPGKGWNTIFRLYGPLKPFYSKTWKPSDPTLVELK